jgi:HAD superfamily hydrolase (TIGR01509 family)
MSKLEFPTAVLWDMDGTLIDSEPYWLNSESQLASDYGSTWTALDGHELIGMNLYESARKFRERFKITDLSDQQIIDRLTAAVVMQLRQKLPWRPGALELLTELRAHGVKTALVTMSMRSMAQHVADQIEFDAFDAIVAGDEVTHGKPHPEAYLRACELLEVDPSQSIAIEDSNTGASAAVAAGVLTIAVPNIVPIASGPGRVLVDSLTELNLDRLRLLGANREG